MDLKGFLRNRNKNDEIKGSNNVQNLFFQLSKNVRTNLTSVFKSI